MAGWLYGKITDIRNTFYDSGVFRSHSLGVRTISIGNITTGGTGKTPLVAYVAEILADAGEKVCILTRGYGRNNERERVLVSDGANVLVDAQTGGDEPVELARKLIGKAVVVADANRVAAAAWAKEKFGVTVFVLDDGFQHRRAKRDLDIVCIDSSVPLRFHELIPAGNLRESVRALARANAAVLTRANFEVPIETASTEIRDIDPNLPIFRANTRLRGFQRLDAFLDGSNSGGEFDPTEHSTFAFCGLGNPQPFMNMLAEAGPTLFKPLPDHHRYTQVDIRGIEEDARLYSCDALVTTGKDAVKLKGLKFELPCYVAEVDVVIDDPDGFRSLVLSA